MIETQMCPVKGEPELHFFNVLMLTLKPSFTGSNYKVVFTDNLNMPTTNPSTRLTLLPSPEHSTGVMCSVHI